MATRSLNWLDSDSPMPLYSLLVAGCTCLYIGLIIYRLYLHPLANFPGPRLAAATQWYEAYYELIHGRGAAFTPHIRYLHAKYGPIIRIGPNELSVNDAEFHDKLYSSQPALRDRHPHFSASLGTTKGSFSTVAHHVHRRRRMAYNGFFSSQNVMAAETLLRSRVKDLCTLIESHEDQELDLKTLFAALSFDTFHTWAFGEPLGLFEDLPLAAYYNQTVESMVTGPAALVVRIFPLVIACARNIPHCILQAVSARLGQIFNIHAIILETACNFVRDVKPTNEVAGKDFTPSSRLCESETLFSVITRSKAPAEEKEAVRMAQEGTEMFMAAYTPGRTLFLAMQYLHSRPSTLEDLRMELDSVNPDRNTFVSIRALDSLPYLRAVMKEILRITFPVGSRLPLIAHEELRFNGWTIPADVPVSVNHRSLLFDPDVFVEPEKFIPERWFEKEPAINEKRFYMPFGKGGRACPAKEFATRLIQICLATVIQRFEFDLTDAVRECNVCDGRESLLIAPSIGSNAHSFTLTGRRYRSR